MKTTVLCTCIRSWGVLLGLMACLALSPGAALAQASSFSYQGSLTEGGGLADGMYDVEFGLYSALIGGSELATSESLGVQVLEGLFTTIVDFDSDQLEFGLDWYMEIRVRPEGEASYTALNPRVALGVIPNAVHAEVAEVAQTALTGPFAPADNTPGSSSGVRSQTQTYKLTVDNRRDTNVVVRYPIEITRRVINDPLAIRAAQFDSISIEVERPYASNSNWGDYLRDHEEDVSLEIITEVFRGDSTEFRFMQGRVSGHRIELDPSSAFPNQALTEVLTLSFGQSIGSQGQNPIGGIVSRTTSGFSDGGPNTAAPWLGGYDSLRPGRYTYSFNGFVPDESNAGSLPGEQHDTELYTGRIVGETIPRPLTMLHNVFVDSNNTMWDLFALGAEHNGTLSLLDNSQVIWQPVHTPSTVSVLSGWTLDRADDGGLFEAYQIDYFTEPFRP